VASEEKTEKDSAVDFKPVTQNTKQNTILFNALSTQVKESKYLVNLQLLDIRLTQATWATLGAALGVNKSLKTLKISLCNLNDRKCLEEFMAGVKYNDTIHKISLTDMEIGDEQALCILSMIKF
jgi:hypothetical protein